MSVAIFKSKSWSAVGVCALALLAGCRDSEFSRSMELSPVAQLYGKSEAPHTAAVRWQVVSSSLMDEVCANKSLRELSIVTAKRDGTPILSQIAALPNLETLNIVEAPIADFELSDLAKATKLTSLELSRTGITGEGLKHLAKLPLKRLVIREQYLSLEGLQAIASMPQLEELELNLPDVHWADIPELASKSKLKSLSLTGGFYSFREFGGLKFVANAPQLTKVELSGKNLNDRTVKTISTFDQLQILTIEYCMISEDAVEYLSGLSQLQLVQIPMLEAMSQGAAIRLAEWAEEELIAKPTRG